MLPLVRLIFLWIPFKIHISFPRNLTTKLSRAASAASAGALGYACSWKVSIYLQRTMKYAENVNRLVIRQ